MVFSKRFSLCMAMLNNFNMRVKCIFLGSLLLISCESPVSSQAISDYDQLCQIYREVVSRPVELRMKEAALVQRVQSELPDFFNKNFTYIVKADADQRYRFIKRLADEKLKRVWTCDVMKSYYDTEFAMPAQN